MKLLPINLAAPKRPYFTEEGKEVPGVTTVCRSVTPKDGLHKWYYDLGKQGVEWPIPEEHFGTALGKLIHARAEAYLRGYDGVDPEGIDPALMAASEFGFARFVDRWLASGRSIVKSEHVMVSDRHRVGGTMDILARDKDGLIIVDLKSSGPGRGWPYPDILRQIGGYSVLWHDDDGNDAIARAEVWRLGKSEKDAGEVYEVKNLAKCEAAFLSALDDYYLMREVC